MREREREKEKRKEIEKRGREDSRGVGRRGNGTVSRSYFSGDIENLESYFRATAPHGIRVRYRNVNLRRKNGEIKRRKCFQL